MEWGENENNPDFFVLQLTIFLLDAKSKGIEGSKKSGRLWLQSWSDRSISWRHSGMSQEASWGFHSRGVCLLMEWRKKWYVEGKYIGNHLDYFFFGNVCHIQWNGTWPVTSWDISVDDALKGRKQTVSWGNRVSSWMAALVLLEIPLGQEHQRRSALQSCWNFVTAKRNHQERHKNSMFVVWK